MRPLRYCATYCASGRRRTKIPTAPSSAAKASIGSVVIGPVYGMLVLGAVVAGPLVGVAAPVSEGTVAEAVFRAQEAVTNFCASTAGCP